MNKHSKSLSFLTSNRNKVKLEDGIEEGGGGESMPQQQQDERKKYLERCPTSLSTALSFSSYFRNPRNNESTFFWHSGCRRGTTRCFNTGKDDDTVDAAADDDAVVNNDRKQKEKASTSRMNPTPEKMIDGNKNAMVVDASNTVRGAAFVYVAVDGLLQKILEIEVKEGDSVASIKDKVKEKGRPAFDSVAVFDLQLFRSDEQKDFSKETTESDVESTSDDVEIPLNTVGKALSALGEWNRNTIWGTKRQPLIVKVKRRDISPWNNSDGTFVRYGIVIHSYFSAALTF